ncbi:MAG: helix-turn-helix transcriptional regulator [Planctomycetota bacterium]|nr:helix-turn-helix transcriptional regulator [Planctomycetota bacterium]MED5399352.1 helix-turn-helix transcriptional regulator [Planctomycetota bacterium]
MADDPICGNPCYSNTPSAGSVHGVPCPTPPTLSQSAQPQFGLFLSKTMPPRVFTIDVLLDQLQLTVEDFSEKTGLSFDRAEAIALGRWTPSPSDRQRIADSLEVEIGSVSWGHTMDPRNVRYRQFGLPEEI